jgi:uncharacterized protein YecE (DUF72 family)
MSGVRRPSLRIGTSGWAYREWRHGFYQGVPQRGWLSHCARHFTGIEVNATFYRLPRESTVHGWREATPAEFGFAAKGHRFVTHVKRLADVAEPLARSRAAMQPLGPKLEAMLWQLPPDLGQDLGRLDAFGRALSHWPETRHVLELREPSWFTDETLTVLERHGLGTCISDAPRWPMWDAVTAGIAYVRLHGHERLYRSRYGEAGLAPWAKKVLDWHHAGLAVHVYFDNDAEGAAPADAVALLSMVEAGK